MYLKTPSKIFNLPFNKDNGVFASWSKIMASWIRTYPFSPLYFTSYQEPTFPVTSINSPVFTRFARKTFFKSGSGYTFYKRF